MKDDIKDLSNFGEILNGEHLAQIEKWGHQERHPSEWMLFLTEEVGELAQAISETIYRGADWRDVRKEAVQVATLASKIAIMADQLER